MGPSSHLESGDPWIPCRARAELVVGDLSMLPHSAPMEIALAAARAAADKVATPRVAFTNEARKRFGIGWRDESFEVGGIHRIGVRGAEAATCDDRGDGDGGKDPENVPFSDVGNWGRDRVRPDRSGRLIPWCAEVTDIGFCNRGGGERLHHPRGANLTAVFPRRPQP